MTNRMMEEKSQLNRQLHRTEKLRRLIEASMDLKNETYVSSAVDERMIDSVWNSRHQIVDGMVEQRRELQLHLINDTVDEQNRILRQINDFLLVLSKALCDHGGHQVCD